MELRADQKVLDQSPALSRLSMAQTLIKMSRLQLTGKAAQDSRPWQCAYAGSELEARLLCLLEKQPRFGLHYVLIALSALALALGFGFSADGLHHSIEVFFQH